MNYLLTKRIIYTGKGDLFDFKDGFKVLFHYRVETGDGSEKVCIDDSKLPYPNGYGKPMEIIFGKKFKLPFWENCLKTMRVDEVASFTLPVNELIDYPYVSKQLRDISKKEMVKHNHGSHDHCHSGTSSCMGMAAAAGGLGYPALDDWFKNPCSLIFTFNLLQVFEPEQYERESWSLNAEEKINSIDKLKHEGNGFFVAGLWEKAFNKYCEALTRLDSLILAEKPGEPEHVALDKQKVVFYANIAECKLKMEDFYAAVEACDEALKRDDQNVKALFRRAKAHAGAWNFSKSKQDFQTVLDLDKKLAKVVKKEMELLIEQEKLHKVADAEQYKNMFK